MRPITTEAGWGGTPPPRDPRNDSLASRLVCLAVRAALAITLLPAILIVVVCYALAAAGFKIATLIQAILDFAARGLVAGNPRVPQPGTGEFERSPRGSRPFLGHPETFRADRPSPAPERERPQV